MEGWLEGGKTVVLEHVQKSLLGDSVSMGHAFFGNPTKLTVFPALSRPRKRIFAFLCKRPVNVVAQLLERPGWVKGTERIPN